MIKHVGSVHFNCNTTTSPHSCPTGHVHSRSQYISFHDPHTQGSLPMWEYGPWPHNTPTPSISREWYLRNQLGKEVKQQQSQILWTLAITSMRHTLAIHYTINWHETDEPSVTLWVRVFFSPQSRHRMALGEPVRRVRWPTCWRVLCTLHMVGIFEDLQRSNERRCWEGEETYKDRPEWRCIWN